MKKATKKGNYQKKRGRPSTGRDPVVAIRLPTTLTERVTPGEKKKKKKKMSAPARKPFASWSKNRFTCGNPRATSAGDQIDKLSPMLRTKRDVAPKATTDERS